MKSLPKKLTIEQAKELGCKKWYDGKLCHICYERSPRYVNGRGNTCVSCVKIKRDKHYKAHPEKAQARSKAANKYDPDKYKEAKARARFKAQARKDWAKSEAFNIICEGRSPYTEIDRLNTLIDEDCQLSCNLRDLKELRRVLQDSMEPRTGTTLAKIMCCGHCRKVFDNEQWWRNHRCSGRRKELLWIKDNFPAKLIATRIRIKKGK